MLKEMEIRACVFKCIEDLSLTVTLCSLLAQREPPFTPVCLSRAICG